MPILIDVDDEGWRCVQNLNAVAERAVAATLAHERHSPDSVEVSLLFTGDENAVSINRKWRSKTYAPNVLSFPVAGSPCAPEGEPQPLGDIILAAGVVAREAREQEKSLEAHTSHLLVHGTLHLLGYDHMKSPEAARMEAVETAILRGLGYRDPYQQ